MAFTPPQGCYRQPTESTSLDFNARKSHEIIYKGPYDALKASANAIQIGTQIESGSYALEWRLDRAPGSGLLTIVCSPTDPTPSQSVSSTLLDDIWELRSVRNDLSIFAFCGDSQVEANRALIEAWQKEPDGNLAKAFKFKDSSGAEIQLEDATLAVAKKIAQGKEAVIRFYAALTRTRSYDGPPPSCLENLAEVDIPPYVSTSRAPNGVSTAVAACEWLKMQDDAIGQPDKTWKRVESWWGIPKTAATGAHPWDPDFYGSTPWSMPYAGS